MARDHESSLVRKKGDKVYVDKLLEEIIDSRKAVLKELAYR